MAHKLKHHIEVSSVALVDLKAEISRRQVELKEKVQKLPDGCTVIKSTPTDPNAPKRSIWKRPPKETPDVRDFKPSNEAEQADEQWERSRRALEAKAKLYEALKAAAMSGTHSYSKSRLHPEDSDDGPLVDFELKAHEEIQLRKSPSPVRSCTESDSESSGNPEDYEASQTDEEWETYTDDRGIKRTCMRKDHPYNSETEPPPRPDGPLTYAHLREGEIRDHGVGFYAFSEDADERAAQMARLKELHRATEEGRARAQAIRVKRDARMGQRLARLRARKGLPDVATAAAQCLAENTAPPTPLPVSADAQSDIRLGSDDLDVASMLRRLRDEAELRASLNNPDPKPPSTSATADLEIPANLAEVMSSQNAAYGGSISRSREWDRGKSMMSAQRYIQSERERRNMEFAPPSFY
ncbi:Coiled-coil domain-containing protein [Fasciolopsis buskii]|uniref:Coiled-coil domain-containing protein n=1 Tax=Fasciolopsis buskii TaxID=27845 RepID=A0A8E0RSB0_9TREM|nr:Coiled-coil domain-containing protein [Fasciolopsis buski]